MNKDQRWQIAVQAARDLNGAGLKMVIAMLDAADANLIYYGTIDSVAKRGGVPDRTQWRGINDAKDAGYIEVISRGTSGCPGTYRVMLPKTAN